MWTMKSHFFSSSVSSCSSWYVLVFSFIKQSTCFHNVFFRLFFSVDCLALCSVLLPFFLICFFPKPIIHFGLYIICPQPRECRMRHRTGQVESVSVLVSLPLPVSMKFINSTKEEKLSSVSHKGRSRALICCDSPRTFIIAAHLFSSAIMIIYILSHALPSKRAREEKMKRNINSRTKTTITANLAQGFRVSVGKKRRLFYFHRRWKEAEKIAKNSREF